MNNLVHGDIVSVYDNHGNFECRGKIVGITNANPVHYDIAPLKEFSLKSRLCGYHESRVKKFELELVEQHG